MDVSSSLWDIQSILLFFLLILPLEWYYSILSYNTITRVRNQHWISNTSLSQSLYYTPPSLTLTSPFTSSISLFSLSLSTATHCMKEFTGSHFYRTFALTSSWGKNKRKGKKKKKRRRKRKKRKMDKVREGERMKKGMNWMQTSVSGGWMMW